MASGVISAQCLSLGSLQFGVFRRILDGWIVGEKKAAFLSIPLHYIFDLL